MVNSQTPGFHAQRVVSSPFEQELVSRIEEGNTQVIGNANPITIVETVSTQFQTGNLKNTDRSMDVGINGQGYYAIPGADGVTYLTRNGGFDVDQQGYLVLPDVGRVQGSNGPIQVGDTNFTVMDDGTVYNSQGQIAGTLQAVLPPEGTELTQYQNRLVWRSCRHPIGGSGRHWIYAELPGAFQRGLKPGIHHVDGSPEQLCCLQHSVANHRPDQSKIRGSNRKLIVDNSGFAQ